VKSLSTSHSAKPRRDLSVRSWKNQNRQIWSSEYFRNSGTGSLKNGESVDSYRRYTKSQNSFLDRCMVTTSGHMKEACA
jgi:hypothetical protein